MIDMRKVAYIVSALVLTGCGGGGDSGNNSVSVATNSSQQSPVTLSLSVNKTFVRTGETLTVTWDSTNSSGCTASGNWSGAKAKSGSETFEVSNAGKHSYTLECSGTGTSAKQSQAVIVPYPVYTTSYENKNSIPFDTTQVPTIRALGIKIDSDEQDSNERSITFGDFFQEGKISAFVVTTRHKNVYGIANLSDSPAKAYFLSQNDTGKWVDRTSELIKVSEDRYNCVTVSYAMTADFNNDKVPDVFLSCNGIDYDLGGGTMNVSHPNFRQTYLDYLVVYLSQSDKTYKKVKLPYQVYAHQAAVADLNKDGAVDVVLTNQISESERLPVVLMGNGDGSFYKNTTFLPNELLNQNKNGLYQVQIIPIDNRLDILFGYTNETLYLRGNQNGTFDVSTAKIIRMPVSVAYKTEYVMPLDVIYKEGHFYFSTNTAHKDGTEWAIVKTNMQTMSHTVTLTFNNFTNNFQSYSAQIKLNKSGEFVAYTGGCKSDTNQGMCGLKVKF